VGVPEPGEVAPTVAVKVTDWPAVAELAEAVRPVVVAALLMLSVALLVLVVKFVSPE
jgi:hypothetical protein